MWFEAYLRLYVGRESTTLMPHLKLERVFILLLLLVFTPLDLLAQSYSPPPQSPPPPYQYPQSHQVFQSQGAYQHHQGFMFGFGLGGGASTFVDCDACFGEGKALAFDFQLGAFVTPKLALMIDTNGTLNRDEAQNIESSQSMGLLALAAQVWLKPHLWLKAGLGVATTKLVQSLDDGTTVFEGRGKGAGLTLAVGAEVLHIGNFAVDLSGRFNALTIEAFNVATGLEENAELVSGSLLLGVRWK